jgi:peptidyl-dipeptidase Dcp
VRAGACADDAAQGALKEMNAELATLGTQFNQNVLAEVNASAIVVDEPRRAGRPDRSADRRRRAEAAKARPGRQVRDRPAQHHRPAAGGAAREPRAAPEDLHEASVARGSRGNQWDNTGIVSRCMKLRAERAKLLGSRTYAATCWPTRPPRTRTGVNAMLRQLAPAAVANAKREAADLQAMIDQEQKAKGQPTFQLEPWDWAYYTEKVRQRRSTTSTNPSSSPTSR